MINLNKIREKAEEGAKEFFETYYDEKEKGIEKTRILEEETGIVLSNDHFYLKSLLTGKISEEDLEVFLFNIYFRIYTNREINIKASDEKGQLVLKLKAACEAALKELEIFYDAVAVWSVDGSRPKRRLETLLRAALAEVKENEEDSYEKEDK